MRESFGSVFLYNIIILFIIVTFAFLSGTLSYMKAFKANSRIVNAIEKYEGYNGEALTEINNVLNTLGYRAGSPNCKVRDGVMATTEGTMHDYCIYHYERENNKDYYGVLTYMYFDFPIVGQFKIPLFTKTEKVYYFTEKS